MIYQAKLSKSGLFMFNFAIFGYTWLYYVKLDYTKLYLVKLSYIRFNLTKVKYFG